MLLTYTDSRMIFSIPRFTKDLKPSDISLSFLRGKGELRNLELNSELITDALRLPPWISVDRVFCDSVRVSVPFTDLHKSPIHCVSKRQICSPPVSFNSKYKIVVFVERGRCFKKCLK